MPRYKLTLEYDGTPYVGWQAQKNGRGIQTEIETAVAAYCGEKVEVFCAGRTDAGVHATGQVVHVDVMRDDDPHTVMRAINHHLGEQPIAVLKAERVSDDFHARFSATYRAYRYRLVMRSAPLTIDRGRAWHVAYALDIDAMRAAAQALLGNHDFSSFRDTLCQSNSPVKTLDVLDIVTNGTEGIVVVAQARSFLHHMVRNIVGTLVDVGRGRFAADDMTRILEARARAAAGPTAPPHGLYLVEVGY